MTAAEAAIIAKHPHPRWEHKENISSGCGNRDADQSERQKQVQEGQLAARQRGYDVDQHRCTRSQMSEHRPFFTTTRIELALWATTMLLLTFIPERYWHYPDDLWLRIVVMAPAMAAIALFLFDKAKRPARDPKLIFDRRTLWQDLEVIFVTVVVAGIVYWKFKLGS